MSVLMTLRVSANPKSVEETDPEVLQTVVDRAKSFGVLSHHFYGSENEVLVIDEWPDEQSFHSFFEASPEIKGIMDSAGAGEPEIRFWRHLDVDDDIG